MLSKDQLQQVLATFQDSDSAFLCNASRAFRDQWELPEFREHCKNLAKKFLQEQSEVFPIFQVQEEDSREGSLFYMEPFHYSTDPHRQVRTAFLSWWLQQLESNLPTKSD